LIAAEFRPIPQVACVEISAQPIFIFRESLSSAAAAGDYVRAHELAVKMSQNGKAEGSDLNRLAWYALLTGKMEPEDLGYAIKAVQQENNFAALHSLGCVYAEIGKMKEARDILIPSMDRLNVDEPEPNTWYGFGRIAEQDGEIDVAKADYERVTRPKREMEIAGSSYRLAQNRLTILGSTPH